MNALPLYVFTEPNGTWSIRTDLGDRLAQGYVSGSGLVLHSLGHWEALSEETANAIRMSARTRRVVPISGDWKVEKGDRHAGV